MVLGEEESVQLEQLHGLGVVARRYSSRMIHWRKNTLYQDRCSFDMLHMAN